MMGPPPLWSEEPALPASLHPQRCPASASEGTAQIPRALPRARSSVRLGGRRALRRCLDRSGLSRLDRRGLSRQGNAKPLFLSLAKSRCTSSSPARSQPSFATPSPSTAARDAVNVPETESSGCTPPPPVLPPHREDGAVAK